MDRRAELGKIFREILGNGNVYFQPPSNTQMRYPAIRYERSEMAVKHADRAILNDFTLIYNFTTGTGTLTAQCLGAAPTVNIPVKVVTFT